MYRKTILVFNQTEQASVIRIADGACIPFNEDNTDYKEYLLWLSKGNKPAEAVEGDLL
tara:strand:+ start:1114 stop:1287 length:174 start_codon:yes stop_codon:yes gene_type:complete